MNVCIHSFIKPCTPFFAPDTVLGAGDTALKDADEAPILMEWGFLTRQWKT